MTEPHKLELSEGDRQLVLMALGRLAVDRPGFIDTLQRIAAPIDDKDSAERPRLMTAFYNLYVLDKRTVARTQSPIPANPPEFLA